MAARPELQIENGELAGRRYAVGENGLRLGRSSSNDVIIADEELSRNHCLFEPVGQDGLRVTDLASANGTVVNGKLVDKDPVVLRPGDIVEVGATKILVVGDGQKAAAGSLDLGLGGGDGHGQAPARRPAFVGVLWAVAALSLVAAIAALLMMPSAEQHETVRQVEEDAPVVREVVYEKVEADMNGIFRYELSLAPGGVLSVAVDDIPKNERRFAKQQQLGEEASKALNEILAYDDLRKLDREYVGPEPDPPALSSFSLKVVYSSHVRSVQVVNTQEPEAFRLIRERLEAFSKNELGVWAIQYSRDKLVSLAEESLAVARSKWDERDVNHGNLFGAITAFKEALFYLETVFPKPECAAVARSGLDAAVAEMDKRYRDQRFLADRAIKLEDWETARRELSVLIEMIPDRNDDRHRQAASSILEVERKVKGGK